MKKKGSQYCQCLYYSANALARIMTRMADEEFASLGMTTSYAFLLLTAGKRPGIQPGEISAEMQLTPSTVTRLIEKMEQRGLMERRSNGKFTEVYLTTEGVAKIPEIKSCWMNLYTRYSAVLGEKDAAQLTSMIYDAVIRLDVQ
jgi:MarR family transcriptional regulator, organic hydroperoxide resistance regulator